ncbi:MAG: type II secretion system protein [Pseudomonadota bacterium]|nr:type II secretion system protein [Pseudomonadota bacterium]
MTYQQKNKGFTLPDVILVMAILAVLITSLYPSLSSYLLKGKEKEELNRQIEIVDAFESYLSAVGEFPTLPATANILNAPNFNNAWTRVSTVFSSDTTVTNLSLSDMQTDEFDQTRLLLTDTSTVNFAGGTYNVYYIAVVSLGADGCFGVEANPAPPCDNVAPTSLADVDGAPAFTINDYDSLVAAAGSDDIITKYTDASVKTQSYNSLLLQISSIEEALDQFAYQTRKRAETIIERECQDNHVSLTYSIYNCYSDIRTNTAPGNAVATVMPDTQIFVPPSTGEVMADYDVVLLGSRYIQDEVRTATGAVGTLRNRIYNTDGASQAIIRNRKDGMVALMSILGLPSRYCCNPLDKYFDHTTRKWEKMPLFYQSNPRRVSVAP